MTKQQNIDDPNSCWNKAGPGERVFVLRDRDDAMAATIRFWAHERVRLGLNKPGDAKTASALAGADEVEQIQAARSGQQRL
jgi:hypothetical protein